MSLDTPMDLLDITIPTNHKHESLGILFNRDMIVMSCAPGTPAAKIKGWRHTLKGTKLIQVNGKSVQSRNDVIRYIDRTQDTNIFQFASHFQTPVHPETGTTQITFDQFVTIAKHHQVLFYNNIAITGYTHVRCTDVRK